MKVFLVSLSLLVAAFVFPNAASGAVIIVPDDFPTIQAAVDAAVDGDEIFIKNGYYYENVVVCKNLTFEGESIEHTQICGCISVVSDVFTEPARKVEIHHLWLYGSLEEAVSKPTIKAKNTVLSVRNCIIFSYFLMIQTDFCSAGIMNNTFLGNGTNAEGISLSTSEAVIKNNIFAWLEKGIIASNGSSAVIEYNNFWQVKSIFGPPSISVTNISEYPMFADYYHLQYGSPCVDAGDPEMRDPDGSRINMGAYGGTQGATPPFGWPVTITYYFPHSGWYLISIPVVTDEKNLFHLFPNLKRAVTWNAGDQKYLEIYEWSTHWRPDEGIWIEVSAPGTVAFRGYPVLTYTKDIWAGWNLIGSTYEQSWGFDNPMDNPDGSIVALFGFDPFRFRWYYPETVISPKRGYWAYSTRHCILALGLLPPGLKKLAKPTDLTPPPPPWVLSEVEEKKEEKTVPTEFSLSQNFPNPFNPETTIRYQLPQASQVTLKVYNLLGEEVATLINKEEKPPGSYTVHWRPDLAAGTYIYRLRAGNFVETRKMVFLK